MLISAKGITTSENICFAKTNSRVLTGLMNEQKLFLEYDYYNEGDFPVNIGNGADGTRTHYLLNAIQPL